MTLSVSTQANPIGTKMAVETAASATANNDIFGTSGTFYVIDIDNTANGSASYVKLYNSAAPTVGTTAPDWIFRVAANTRRSFVSIEGHAFTNLSLCCVTAGGTAGTTSPGASVVVRILAS